MRFFSSALAATAAAIYLALTSAPVSALNTITTDGRYFVDSVTGDTFWIKGVDYQPGGSSNFTDDGTDPLSDSGACARDIYLLQNLGVNTIRIYSVDPTLNHDECMSLLATAGIYLVLDVNTPLYGQNLDRSDPSSTYTSDYLSHVFQVMEAFSGYNNTLAFFAGNEIVNDATSAKVSAPYIKAVVRDMKAYMSNHLKRQIPIGYSAADDLLYRASLPAYLECGEEDETIDFYGVNSYQWCGDQTFTSSGYSTLVEDYQNFSLPIFLSEYGCNNVLPRTFEEVTAIFSDKFSIVFSGGLVYEYSEETSNYGLVNISSDGSAQLRDDYVTLSSRYAAATTTSLSTADATARPTTCSSSYENIVITTDLPDSPGSDLIDNGIGSSYNRGAFVKIDTLSTNYTIYDVDGNEITDTKIAETYDITVSSESAIEQTDSDTQSDSGSSPSSTATATGSASSSSSTSGAVKNAQKLAAAVVLAALVAIVFV